MKPPQVSLIIASRDRPDHLRLCLNAVTRLACPSFEIVVVADPAGLAAVAEAGLADRIKTVAFDVPNISKARNLGIAQSAGEIVAFIDDDAVPEPGWLAKLAAAFAMPGVVAATGFVRGRDGISYQARGQTIDCYARVAPLDVPTADPLVLAGDARRAISTIGTNCAFRRDIFRDHGLFDPLFRYFLDESDLNMRLAQAGLKTAIVPRAEVHHAMAASPRRRENRVPVSLQDIGFSTGIFLRKHAPDTGRDAARQAALARQEHRLERRLARGNCTRADIDRLLATMEDGLNKAAAAQIAPVPMAGPVSTPFLRFEAANPRPRHHVIAGLRPRGAHRRKRAADLARAGDTVTLFEFSLSARAHRVRFHPDGYWEQTGGLFGRSGPDDARFRLTTLARRVARECNRVAPARNLAELATSGRDDRENSG